MAHPCLPVLMPHLHGSTVMAAWHPRLDRFAEQIDLLLYSLSFAVAGSTWPDMGEHGARGPGRGARAPALQRLRTATTRTTAAQSPLRTRVSGCGGWGRSRASRSRPLASRSICMLLCKSIEEPPASVRPWPCSLCPRAARSRSRDPAACEYPLFGAVLLQ